MGAKRSLNGRGSASEIASMKESGRPPDLVEPGPGTKGSLNDIEFPVKSPNLFGRLGVEWQKERRIGKKKRSAASRLYQLLRDEIKEEATYQELEKLYDFETEPDGSWKCNVHFRGRKLGEAKDATKKMARESGATMTLWFLFKDEKYFDHFVIKMPSKTDPTH